MTRLREFADRSLALPFLKRLIMLLLFASVSSVLAEIPELKITRSANTYKDFTFDVTMIRTCASNEVNVIMCVEARNGEFKEKTIYIEVCDHGQRLAGVNTAAYQEIQGKQIKKPRNHALLFSVILSRDVLRESWAAIRVTEGCVCVIRFADWVSE